MPSAAVIRRNAYSRLVPFYPGSYDRRRPVNLAPSTTFPAGQVLGISGVAANNVQTLTTTGTPTGGSQTITFTDPNSGDPITFVVAFDSTNTQAQTAMRAAIGNSDVVVTGGPQPGSTLIFTFSGTRYAGRPIYPMTTVTTGLTGGTTPAASFAQTTAGRTANTYGIYVGGSATDPAKCLLEYACITDAAGYATFGTTAATDGSAEPSVPAYFGGVFRIGDTTGMDAGALVDMGARMESGAVTDADGIFIIL
jgi:hypothetical protein